MDGSGGDGRVGSDGDSLDARGGGGGVVVLMVLVIVVMVVVVMVLVVVAINRGSDWAAVWSPGPIASGTGKTHKSPFS